MLKVLAQDVWSRCLVKILPNKALNPLYSAPLLRMEKPPVAVVLFQLAADPPDDVLAPLRCERNAALFDL